MQLFTFWHGRFAGEPWAWAEYQPGSVWVVTNGRAFVLTWGEGRESPWGRAASGAKPSAT